MKRDELPDVVTCAERVSAALEVAVARFPRKHRYTLGQDIRRSAEQACLSLHLAWKQPHRRRTHADAASDAIDLLKLRMQRGQDIQAFVSFEQFEDLYRLAEDLGRRCGGWLGKLRGSGRNAQAPSHAQSAQILSSRAATGEVAAS